jgi:hypothetical protein
MRRQTVRDYLERLSFFLWIGFTILSISLTGIGVEGLIFAVLIVSSAQALHFSLAIVLGAIGVFLSMRWRQAGVDHLHYLSCDTVIPSEEDSPSRILGDLIHEIALTTGSARTDARSKAKAWLINHVSSLDEEDIRLAQAHFGYLLPEGGGRQPNQKGRSR